MTKGVWKVKAIRKLVVVTLLPSSDTMPARVRGENPASEATTIDWMMKGKRTTIVPENREFPQVHPAPVTTDDQIFGITSPFASPKGSSVAGKFELIGTGKGDLAEALKTWTKVKVPRLDEVPATLQEGGAGGWA